MRKESTLKRKAYKILSMKSLKIKPMGKQAKVNRLNQMVGEAAKHFKINRKMVIGEVLKKRGWKYGEPLPKINSLIFRSDLIDRWGTPERWKKDIQYYRKMKKKWEEQRFKDLNFDWRMGKLKLEI